MTDKANDGNQPIETGASTVGQDDGDKWTRKQWVNLATNPTQQHLGYDIAEWNSFETGKQTDEVLFLPNTETELEDAAFVVSTEESLVDLQTRC